MGVKDLRSVRRTRYGSGGEKECGDCWGSSFIILMRVSVCSNLGTSDIVSLESLANIKLKRRNWSKISNLQRCPNVLAASLSNEAKSCVWQPPIRKIFGETVRKGKESGREGGKTRSEFGKAATRLPFWHRGALYDDINSVK